MTLRIKKDWLPRLSNGHIAGGGGGGGGPARRPEHPLIKER
jgi:hypothetical protein